MKKMIKNAIIVIILLSVVLSCFEVKAGDRVVKAGSQGVTSVILDTGELINLYPGEQVEIYATAKAYYFVDNLDYVIGYNRTGDEHDPSPHVQLRDTLALMPRIFTLCTVAVLALRRLSESTTSPVFTRGHGRKIAMVDLQYPHSIWRWFKKVYLSGSLFTVAAQFWHAGWDVEVIDFNIDYHNSPRVRAIFNEAEVIGVSVVGAPYLKQLVSFCKRMKKQYPDKPVLLGGQVMKAFLPEQFARLFADTNAVLIKDQTDLCQVDIPPESLPDALEVSLQPILERLPEGRLEMYLSHEMPLVLSQNCQFNCDFCAASKAKSEKFKNSVAFSRDLLFMVNKAKEFGISKLEFYATSLDFFQTPHEIERYLRAIAEIRQSSGVDIKVRALACMSSFLQADRRIDNLDELLRLAGFYCVGFGVDGPTQEIWNSEGKTQNHESDIPKVLQRTEEMGIQTEILMIMGDRRYDARLLLKTVHVCYGYVIDWSHTVIRLHIAKVLPGSREWFTNNSYVNQILADPSLGANLDVLAVASPLTHPVRKQRWQVNLAYLAIFLPARWFGGCVSSTLLPSGGRGVFSIFARIVNLFMPYDR